VQLAIALATLFALSASGHAAAASPSWRAIAFDWVHLVAVACWLGALPYLALAVHRAANTPGMAVIWAVVAALSRFSRLALGLMAAIIATGFLRGYVEVAGPTSLVKTDYGIVLIAKHLLLVPILIGAGANRLAVVPRLIRAAASGVVIEVRAALRAARVLLLIELGAATVIVIAAAVLTQLAPANGPLAVDVATRPATIDQRASAGELSIELLARIAGESNDRYTLTVTDTGNAAPASIQRVIVQTATTVDGATVGDRFDAEPLADAPGTYEFPAVRIALRGQWTVQVIVRRAGLDDVTAPFQIDTTALGTQPPRLVADHWRWPRVTVAAWLFGVFALALLIGGVIAVKRLRALDPFAAAIMLTMLALIVGGFAVQGIRKTVPITAGSVLANPDAGDAASVQRGEGLYAELCLKCHGVGGVGIDNTDPNHQHGSGTNLIDERTQSQRDGDLYWSITNGKGGTDMPAFDLALTEQERWDLVNYLRALAES
jgi:copper transport protein